MMYNHNNLPEAVESLHQKIDRLERLITESIKRDKVIEIRETMDTRGLIEMVTSQGLRMSKSKLYKLVSTRKIPYSKFNGCLVLSRQDIQDWIDRHMVSSSKTHNEAVTAIARSAQNQERRVK